MLSTSKSFFRNPSAGGATDPSFAYVPLLLNTTSTNGQQNNTFLDSGTANGGVGFTITRNGTPTQGSITPYWPNGQWSNYFGGVGSYLTTNSTPIGTTTSTFTIECWIYPTAAFIGTVPAVIGDMQPTGANNYFSFGPTVANTLQLYWYDGINKSCTGNTTIQQNVWTHIAVSVNANAISLYVNGTQQTLSGTTTLTNRSGTVGFFAIAQFTSSTVYYTGYISNLSVLSGTAKYSTGFTPTTSPLSVSTANQTLLACYSNRFIDANTATAAKTVTPTGTPRVQAFQPFSPTASYTTALYGGSGYFNGSTDYLTAGTSAALNPGAGNFTFECWVYATSAPTSSAIFSANLNGLGVGFNSSQLGVSQTGIVVIITDPATFALNQWVHVAAVRSGTTLSLYKNGTRVATTASSSTNFVTSTQTFIASNGTTQFPGYISNLRLAIGAVVYDPTLTTLTVPTAPVTAITNTSLLLNMANAGIYDAAVQNNAITVGDAQVSTTITAQWPPTSMKFDGTGDWLTAIDNPQLQLGTGNFTIEGWFYLTANGTAYGIVSKGAASTGWSVNVTSGNRIQFSYTAANLTGATTTLAAATWYYFAVVRSGSATGNLKIYINGALEVTSGGAVTDNFNQTNILYVGASRTGTTPLNGYLEDIRITTAARTITASPTAAFPTR